MEVKHEFVSNGTYVIRRLKAFYPSFRNHLERLDLEGKKFLQEDYDKAFKHLTLRDISDKVSIAIAESPSRLPSIDDIRFAVIKNSNAFKVEKKLPNEMGERQAQEHNQKVAELQAICKGDPSFRDKWREFLELGVKHFKEQTEFLNS